MWSGGPNPGGSSASRSEKTPFVSSEFALTVIANAPRSIDLPSPGANTYASLAPAIVIASESGVFGACHKGEAIESASVRQATSQAMRMGAATITAWFAQRQVP